MTLTLNLPLELEQYLLQEAERGVSDRDCGIVAFDKFYFAEAVNLLQS
ncbi:hypothetical protein H6G17_00515 [Chroococcidiopsis sp. FACHB-1243]|nr:hypothetical protein [Chroococcidiopsis sp. [FACHB-1243]]MBD2304004.1 hypothetical protein [Chroococcidiopsis sp. [FACHB-1243]]